jgi:hypothetical protein
MFSIFIAKNKNEKDIFISDNPNKLHNKHIYDGCTYIWCKFSKNQLKVFNKLFNFMIDDVKKGVI